MSAPVVAVVIGASGGAGATTLALGVALHLAMTSRHPTLLELDLVKGGLAAGLGIDADRGLHDLRPVADELKPEHLARVAYPHRAGMSVILAPGPSRDAGEWDGAAIGRLVVAASAGRKPVVVDGGTGLTFTSAAASRTAAHVFVVTTPSVVGASRARAVLDGLVAPGRLVVGPPLGREDLGDRATGLAVGVPVASALPRSPGEAHDLGSGRWPRGRRLPLATAIARLAEGLE